MNNLNDDKGLELDLSNIATQQSPKEDLAAASDLIDKIPEDANNALDAINHDSILTENDQSSLLTEDTDTKQTEVRKAKTGQAELEDKAPKPIKSLNDLDAKQSATEDSKNKVSDQHADSKKPSNKRKDKKKQSKERTVDKNFEQEYNTIIKSLRSNVVSHDPEEYENLKVIIEQIGELGKNSFELQNAMQQTDEFRQKMLDNEFKNGLSRGEEPFGSHQPVQAAGICRLTLAHPDYLDFSVLSQKLEEFGILIRQRLTISNQHQYNLYRKECNNLLKKLYDEGKDAARAVRTQNQKRAWIQLLKDDGSKLSRLEIDRFMLNVNNILVKHRELIDAHESWENNRKGPEPSLKPLLNDVHEVINGLDLRLNEITPHLNTDEKATIERFTQQLQHYYQDQIEYGLSGGRSFNPIKQSLGVIQKELRDSNNFHSVMETSSKLEDGIEKLNVLHWVMDHLAESIYKKEGYTFKLPDGKRPHKTTSGHMISAINYYNSKNKTITKEIQKLRSAREHRNEIAHTGLIFDPEKMQQTCDAYESSINFLSSHFNIQLQNVAPDEKTRPLDKESINDILRKQMVSLKYRGSIFRMGLDAMQGALAYKFRGKSKDNTPAEPTFENAVKTLRFRKSAEQNIKDTIRSQFNTYEGIEKLLIEASQHKDNKGQSLDLTVDELTSLVRTVPLNDFFYLDKRPEETSKKLRLLIQNHFAQKTFNKSYKDIRILFKQAELKKGVDEKKAGNRLFPAAIKSVRNKQRLSQSDLRFLDEVTTVIRKEIAANGN